MSHRGQKTLRLTVSSLYTLAAVSILETVGVCILLNGRGKSLPIAWAACAMAASTLTGIQLALHQIASKRYGKSLFHRSKKFSLSYVCLIMPRYVAGLWMATVILGVYAATSDPFCTGKQLEAHQLDPFRLCCLQRTLVAFTVLAFIVCCALSMAVWLHNEPFAASLSGVCTASGRHCSNEQVGVRASQVVSEKALSLASSEATSYGCRPTPTVAARARTSWLPPLLFQLPANITSSYPLQTSASSIAAPTRPLIRRSQSTSASVTSSSFYSRSSASSDTTISHQPSAIGTTSYRAEDLSTYGPPSSKSQAFGKPEVPPIPEKWRTAGRGLPPAVRPSRPGTRPGLPPPTCWQYNAEYGDSSSWMTETTPSADRGRRDPSTSRYPIMYPAPGSNIFPGDVDGMLERRIGACRSSENLRRSGSTQAASKGLATAGWLDLDDRADRSFTKGKAKGKERRTLVKKRQPRDL